MNLKYTQLLIILSVTMLSCQKDVVPETDFDVHTEKNTYKVGEEIQFTFSGNAENIVFWSGETGKQYVNRSRASEKGSPYLRFTSAATAGSQADGLSVLISKDFTGSVNAASIAAATWTNIAVANAELPATNLALGRTYTASGIRNAVNGPEKAFDRSMSTVWIGLAHANQWLQIAFGEPVTFNTVVMREVAIRATAYRIEYSNDGNTWNTAVAGNAVGTRNVIAFPAVTASFLRVFYVSGGNDVNLGELEIYNVPALEKKALLSTINTAGVAGMQTPTVVDLSDFANSETGEVYIAFKNTTTANALKPRGWNINNVSVTNTLRDGTINTIIANVTAAGFKLVDVKNANFKWSLAPNLTNPVLLSIGAGEAGEAENEDWAVTGPIALNKVQVADAGAPVTSITTLSPPTFYKYAFNTPGTYTVTFHAFNQSIKEKKEVVKELQITVTP